MRKRSTKMSSTIHDSKLQVKYKALYLLMFLPKPPAGMTLQHELPNFEVGVHRINGGITVHEDNTQSMH